MNKKDVILASQGRFLLRTGSMPHLSAFIVTDQKEKNGWRYKKKKNMHLLHCVRHDETVTASQHSSVSGNKGSRMLMHTMTPDMTVTVDDDVPRNDPSSRRRDVDKCQEQFEFARARWLY